MNDITLGNLRWDIGDSELDTLSEIFSNNNMRYLSEDESIGRLFSQRIDWITNPINSNIVTLNFRDINNPRDYATLAFRKEDLPNALYLLGAMNDYYQQDITDQLDEDRKMMIRNQNDMRQNERINRYLIYDPEARHFIGLKYVSPGVYNVIIG